MRNPTQRTRYRGQTIVRDDTVPIDRRGRYTWGDREYAQLNHAKSAINDHYRQHTADERDRHVDNNAGAETMYTVILYVTMCLGGIDNCHAREPITWTADEVILQETAQICSALAESVTVDAGENPVVAECHIIGPDERDRYVDQ